MWQAAVIGLLASVGDIIIIVISIIIITIIDKIIIIIITITTIKVHLAPGGKQQ